MAPLIHRLKQLGHQPSGILHNEDQPASCFVFLGKSKQAPPGLGHDSEIIHTMSS